MSRAQRLPVVAIIERNPDLRICRRVQQSLLARILTNGVCDRAWRDAVVDLSPALAAVVRAPEVRIEIVEAQRVGRGVRGAIVEVSCIDVENARPRLDRRGGVTLLHVVPPFVVIWMLPSSVPAHSTPMLRDDGERAVIAPCGLYGDRARVFPCVRGHVPVCRVRSGLMRVQRCPRSIVFHTAFDV